MGLLLVASNYTGVVYTRFGNGVWYGPSGIVAEWVSDSYRQYPEDFTVIFDSQNGKVSK